ncbi:site-specific integrase [Paenibacillus antibioticophila]|uniref:Site-specific integrase n=1 Tax=Paenibacillus antibioticophila TaxID=1274374 RepID=A0A920CG84_9BACL|nr:tyrosine-type recombinase/integrase [Paenibacillus antibioticophila]GIO39056.1 site-specific integrase [Paenibacillus antibioticophila]
MPIYPYIKKGKEHYYYAFEVKKKDGSRKTIKQRGFKGKTEARAAERQARVDWEKGQYIDPSKMTVTEYMDYWLENKHNISDETLETNKGHIKNHITPAIGSIPFQKLTVDDIHHLVKSMQDKELADGTIRKVFNLIQTAYNSAQVKELIVKNPFSLLDKGSRPKPSEAKVDYWSVDEVKHFFSVLNHRQRILFILAIYTGMRRGEILGLRWKDIDFENSQIRIRQTLKPRQKIKKGGKNSNAERSITCSNFVKSELRKHKTMVIQECWDQKREFNDEGFVVCHSDGKPMNVGNFHRFWKRILANNNMREIRFHDLRHTCASLLLTSGAHPKVVQELLGHSSIKITLDTYSHLMPNMQGEAVDKLDKMLN